ncbi:DUF1735 domain-containing protein [Litoribacter alkaliphilus]|uniref:DUF1735 domain-containing protein n=1 Tax=Litoribacter ruber TaxID=702568 RepID=A0AAP2G0G0_9BACT|nr:DUF5627 domain-containing protein [Litoribacter alkaliphilus]MBS9522739.1 DUF1735 domain-containing protein [Litoribacter alkaliphilus]
MKKIVYILVVVLTGLTSCVNQDWEFPDFDFQSVYFAHQYPVRTITLGEDIFDTTLDNEWKFRILATTGGVYNNRNDISMDFTIDNSLVEGLVFGASGEEIVTMPSHYYGITGENFIIPKGSLSGGVEIQLTEDFFNDPLAIRNTYVIPMVISNVVNADTILSGRTVIENPNPHVIGDWDVTRKDFVLYAVKFVNEWHGIYLRRGQDVITGKAGHEELSGEFVRREEFVERDELKDVNTVSLTEVELPLTFQDQTGANIHATLLLTFNNQGECTISSASEGVIASGTGSFVKRGEKKSWGNQDRDALYLDYEIDLPNMHVQTTDTLVMRNRGLAMEFFTPEVR